MLAEEVLLNEGFSGLAVDPGALLIGMAELLLQVGGVVEDLYFLALLLLLNKIGVAMHVAGVIVGRLPQLILVEPFDVHFSNLFLAAVVEIDLIKVGVLGLQLLRLLAFYVVLLAHELDQVGLAQLVFGGLILVQHHEVRSITAKQLSLLLLAVSRMVLLDHAIPIEEEHPLVHLEVFNVELGHQVN